ncbi:GIN domain-containing protein [Adhaeribacter aquaticus]|uniref:GIN domain-containing protein n=1 Tax=Adhaeribacter aquaticus TaxID=299567 RepID=UPI000413B802|nr:DUF2807 domain-containing protein [Adhaeribacter aquaticus]
MKKNISINLQGMIFHIEEDGYEQLSQYLAAIKKYFSAYEGHEEIIADIEARIAEIFFTKLNPSKQVITRDDVQALITQMGSVKDFQTLEEEPEVEYSTLNSANQGYKSQEEPTSRKIFRDEKRKVIAGVAAGIANYLTVDPLWTRLAFVFLTFLFAIPGGVPAALIIFIYIACWIAFPKSTVLPETATRKLFRNPDDKKLGGVASGMALYFGLDVAVIRLIFLISAFLGGGGLLIYIVLWIILPEATSFTDRAQMQGNPITLSGIEESLKTNLRMKDEDGRESTFARIILFPIRMVAQVIQVLARILSPLAHFLVTLVRILAGVLLLFMAGTFIFALFVIAATALNVIDGSSFLEMNDVPLDIFFKSFPNFGIVSGFFTLLIPCILFLILGLGLLLKRFFIRPSVGWSMLAIWILGLFVLVLAIIDFRNDFREFGEFTAQKTFPVATYQTVLLKARDTGAFRDGRANLEIQGYNGNEIRLFQTFSAKGLTESEAIKNAQMVSYRSIQEDSVITLDYNFKFKPNAIYRDQDLSLKLLLPENKTLQLSENFSSMLPAEFFDHEEYSNEEVAQHLWQVKKDKFICLDCPPIDSTSEANEQLSANEDWDNDQTELDSPLQDDDEYGDNTRTYDYTDFNKISVGGNYHLKVRRGSNYSIKVRGEKDALRNLEINNDEGVLNIKSKKNLFRFSFGDQEPVLITISLPELYEADLSGAVRADIKGFDTDEFNFSSSGAVQTALSIKARQLNVDTSGATETEIAGSGNSLKIDASGACQVKASKFKAEDVEADLSGASNARVYVTNKLDAEVSGPSHVTYRGNPQHVNADESGMGRVEKE